MPKRIQMSRQEPWRRSYPGAVIVDRRTPFGNPFRVGETFHFRPSSLAIAQKFAAPVAHFVTIVHPFAAVEYFRAWHEGDMEVQENWPRPSLLMITEELRGRDLACWCALDAPCHADVLLELANPEVADV